ncbi:MAG: methyltransferase domain-containing protein [Candidatus Pelagibacter sp.]
MIRKFLNLGNQPLANSYLNKKQINEKEKKFKLELVFNDKNFLVSINKKIRTKEMFNDNYPYRSSMSNTMLQSFKNISNIIKKRFKPKFIIEIGSNDGAFLFNFNKKNIIGIEPCKNIASITKKKKYKTIDKYWTKNLARFLTKNKKCDLIYSANTLSHIENLDETFGAISLALSNEGVLILEGPSLLPCIKNNIYDQFYCEHIYVFSTLALDKVLMNFDLEIFDLNNLKTHGGSTRYFIKKKDNRKYRINKKVKLEISKERKYGLHRFNTYLSFSKRVRKSRQNFIEILNKLNSRNKKVIGYGATAKSCTVLNYCKINEKKIRYFLDTTPDKINKYLPGSRIKIKKYKKLSRKDADVVFLGAWNFKKEILKKERMFKKEGGKFLIHVPKVKLI